MNIGPLLREQRQSAGHTFRYSPIAAAGLPSLFEGCAMCQSREIPLSQGQVTIVDAQDYEWLKRWKWHAHKGWNTFYAVRCIRKPNGKQTLIRMHRLILETPEDMQTDHRNGDGLDNRRENLRICTRQENAQNQKLPKDNTSGYKGVHWSMRGNQWRVQIGVDGNQIHLGYYRDINEAVVARRAKEKELFGDFVRLI